MNEIARQSITIHPDFQCIWGDLDEETFNNLKSEIQTDGIRDTLVLWKYENRNVLVDGHNRLRIAEQLHINAVPVVWKEFKDKAEAAAWIISHQSARRNLEDWQKYKAAEVYQRILRERAEKNLHKAEGGDRRSESFKPNQGLENSPKVEETVNTRKETAEVSGLSEWKIRQGDYVMEHATPEQIADLDSGKKVLKDVYKEVKKPSKPKEPKPLEPVEEFLNRSRTEAKVKETRTAIGVISVQSQKITDERLNELKNVCKKSEIEEIRNHLKFMIENCQRAMDACNKFLGESRE